MELFSDGGFASGLAADGLPVVPPAADLVAAMLAGGDPELSLGAVPPSLGACRLWRVAACAVMAGCEPRQFPVVVAAVRAALAPEFNAHGAGATTMGCTPVVVVSGGGAAAAGVDCGRGCFGSGHRANATIGRALKLVLHHVGGASIRGTEATTIGTPAKVGACVGERDDVVAGGWGAYGGEAPTASVFPVTSMTQVVDFDTVDAEAIAKNVGHTLAHGCWGARFPMCSSALVLVSPEHYATLKTTYPTRAAFAEALWRFSTAAALPHASGAVSTFAKAKGAGPLSASVAGFVAPSLLSTAALFGKTPMPKFETPEAIHVVVCGGDAGKFTMVCAGFGAGAPGMPTSRLSLPTSQPIENLSLSSTPLPAGAVLDPRSDPAAAERPPKRLAPRTGALRGPVGLLDISKGGGKVFLDGVEAGLRALFRDVEIYRYVKPTFSRTAPEALLDDIAQSCKHVVLGLGD